MIQKPPESLKPFANQLADLMIESGEIGHTHNNEAKINRLKQQLGLSEEDPTRKAVTNEASVAAYTPGSGDNKNEYVGIWKPEVIKKRKFYVRDRNLANEFPLWANVERIPFKGRKTRIVFIGESVARGFLYDPYFTPAAYLAEIINAQLAPNGAEVIDLAKTDLLMNELKEICTSGLKLEPDAVVVFAGNNWVNTDRFSDEDMDRMMTLMETEAGFNEFKVMLEAKYRELTVNFVKHISAVFKDNNIPWVLIIPEFNLMDWKCSELDRLLAWPGPEASRWFQLRKEAEQALNHGHTDKAEPLISEMIKLNPTNPLAYRLMAEYHLGNNRIPEAGKNLELAQDTKMFRFNTVPGTISVIRQTLREEASRYQIPVVDLPVEFAKKGIPGKELFIDYCHLTAEGIQITMALTAQQLLRILKREDIPADRLQVQGSNPGDDVKARAHFFAAIHNAHKGQPYDILYHHCRQAVNLSESIIDFFRHYIDMASRHAPWSLVKSCEALIGSGELSQYAMLLQPDIRRIMDIPLVDAMADALKTKGIDIKDQIDTLRATEHGIQKGKVNLLESYYHLDSYTYTSIFSDGFYRAYDAESCFYLLSENSTEAELQLTCRVPLIGTEEAGISITINDSYATRLTVSKKWKTHRLRIPTEYIRKSLNRIKIQWPTNLDSNEKPRLSAGMFKGKKIDQLKRTVYPVYGEIHNFTAVMLE